jgi:protein TonB
MRLREFLMEFGENNRWSGRRWLGILAVVGMHILLGYALIFGLARKSIEVAQAPIEAKIIEEVIKVPTLEVPPAPPEVPQKIEPVLVPPPVLGPVVAPAEIAITVPQNNPPPPVAEVAKPAATVSPTMDAAWSCRKPEYPSASRRMQEEGLVVLNFMVDVDGRVTDSKIESSSGYPRLDEAARRALSLCKFKPGMSDGKPVAAWARLRYMWRLEE